MHKENFKRKKNKKFKTFKNKYDDKKVIVQWQLSKYIKLSNSIAKWNILMLKMFFVDLNNNLEAN